MKRGYDSTALEAEKTLVEQKVESDFRQTMTLSEYVLVAMAFMMIAAVLLFAMGGVGNSPAIPNGCAVVNNLSACHTEEQMIFLPMEGNTIIGYTPVQVCEKKLACWEGSTREWP
jgi:hypothetical protein